MPSAPVSDDFDKHVALPRTVEFAEKDSLPGTKSELAVFDEQSLTGSGKNRLHVGIGVAFSVAIRTLAWDQPVEDAFDVTGDVWIGVLVDDDARRGMRHVDMAQAVPDSGIANRLFHLAGDINALRAPSGFDAERLHS